MKVDGNTVVGGLAFEIGFELGALITASGAGSGDDVVHLRSPGRTEKPTSGWSST